MSKKYLPIIMASLASLWLCAQSFCQTPPGQFTEQLSIPRATASDKSLPATVSPILNGSAEQQELIDPPFREVPGLVETPPIKGKGSALNWLLMPSVGQGTFEDWLKEAHPDLYLSAEKSDPNSLLEMVGEHETLGPEGHLCGINCRRISMRGIALEANTTRKLLNARPPKVLVYEVNCSCTLNNPQAVRQFVQRGGYLIVTGRDMRGVQEAFPGRIVSANRSLSHDALVDAELFKPDQVLGTNLVTHARWYVPSGFPPIKVVNPQAVRVLCRSEQLATDIPDGHGVLAAMFPYGRGYVLCLVGTLENSTGHIVSLTGVSKQHLRKELPDPAPQIHISLRQGIGANFIEAGLTRKRIPTGISPSLGKF
jgi:hypothetical protein